MRVKENQNLNNLLYIKCEVHAYIFFFLSTCILGGDGVPWEKPVLGFMLSGFLLF